jgi:hypothetical protein
MASPACTALQYGFLRAGSFDRASRVPIFVS